MNILLAGTGSVAAIKYWRLMKALLEVGDVKGILTEKATFFTDKADDLGLSLHIVPEYKEWEWNKIGDEIPHIDLKDWADILVIAPLSANTLAKMANGMCDNLLTSICRAWPLKEKPIVVAPAMNTNMWNHPITREHLDKLIKWNMLKQRLSVTSQFNIVYPVKSTLACGVTGVGAMAPINEIVNRVLAAK